MSCKIKEPLFEIKIKFRFENFKNFEKFNVPLWSHLPKQKSQTIQIIKCIIFVLKKTGLVLAKSGKPRELCKKR